MPSQTPEQPATYGRTKRSQMMEVYEHAKKSTKSKLQELHKGLEERIKMPVLDLTPPIDPSED